MKYPILILFFSLIFLVACEDSSLYEDIEGRWNCNSWTSVQDAQNRCNSDVYFQFNEDKTYISKLGAVIDEGTYSVSGNALTVSPEGKMEIRVDIQKLTNDSLVFIMNAGGVEERMVLLKD